MLNYHIVLQTCEGLLERAVPGPSRAPGHPGHVTGALRNILASAEWLELWWATSTAKYSPEQLEALKHNEFKLEAWFQVCE